MKSAFKRLTSLLFQKVGEMDMANAEMAKRGYSFGFKSSLDPDSSDDDDVAHCKYAEESM